LAVSSQLAAPVRVEHSLVCRLRAGTEVLNIHSGRQLIQSRPLIADS
jgi:hypothetical protein